MYNPPNSVKILFTNWNKMLKIKYYKLNAAKEYGDKLQRRIKPILLSNPKPIYGRCAGKGTKET